MSLFHVCSLGYVIHIDTNGKDFISENHQLCRKYNAYAVMVLILKTTPEAEYYIYSMYTYMCGVDERKYKSFFALLQRSVRYRGCGST